MRLLIVGTLNSELTTASQMALAKGARINHCHTPDEALQHLRQGQGADLVFMDVQHNIAQFIKQLNQERICIPVVACGASTQTEQAVAAIQSGAQEYLPLPPEPDMIAALLEAVSTPPQELIFQDPATRHVVHMARNIAKSDATVLITGESGTGKERIAHLIHTHSNRSSKPFIAINSAAIPEHLLESELFGHEKGAFTGAVARRVGKFEEAQGGTLLLDEISEMHPRLQAKLLRALQEKEIDRLGSKTPVKVDIRIIATSNRDLKQAIRAGDFREDLYFRLNVVNIHLPPLRERPQDILVLAEHFIQKYSKLNQVEHKPLSPPAVKQILDYPWPGNVRELENMMHRAVLLNQGDQIFMDHVLSETVSPSASQGSCEWIGRTVADVEKELILKTLNHCLGNRTHAAQILGISIRTLRNKLQTYAQGHEEDMDDAHSLKSYHG